MLAGILLLETALLLLLAISLLLLLCSLQDCYIDICSPEVLILFNDNFDYQHIRRHFLKGLLQDDVCTVHYTSVNLQPCSALNGF